MHRTPTEGYGRCDWMYRTLIEGYGRFGGVISRHCSVLHVERSSEASLSIYKIAMCVILRGEFV